MYIHQGPTLCLTADGGVVEEGDPRARYVLVADGGSLSDEEAEKYGLTGKKAKAEPPPNKAKAEPPPNKSKG